MKRTGPTPTILALACFGFLTGLFFGQGRSDAESWDQRVTDFLAAERIYELGLEQKDLEPHLFSLLEEGWENDREMLSSILLHTEELIRKEQRRGDGWYRSMWNGWTVLADIMGRYNRSVPGEVGIGTYTRMFRDDKEGVFPTGGGFVHRNNRSLLRTFLAMGGTTIQQPQWIASA